MSNRPLIYIAAPWKRREEAKAARIEFQKAGFQVNTRWLDAHNDDAGTNDINDYPPERLKVEAMNDIEDVLSSDIVVVLNLEPSEGKAVETGIAIMSFKGIITVGPRLNVFQFMNIPNVDTLEEAIVVAGNYPWQEGQFTVEDTTDAVIA